MSLEFFSLQIMAHQHLSVILLLFIQETSSDGKASSCSIPPVEDGGTAVLTCKFDTDIYETKDGFQVERYSTAKNKQESLLACQWISDKLECHLHASVQFNRNISNTFQLVLPFVTSDDFGEYVCHVLPTSNVISKRCYLTIIVNNMTTDNATLMAAPASIPETSNKGSDGVALIIASLSMAAVGILIVMKIGSVVHARLSQKQSRSYNSLNMKHSKDEDEEYDEYLRHRQEGVEHAPLNQNQDSRKSSGRPRPPTSKPVTSEDVDNYIEPEERGGVEHAPLNQNQVSSKSFSRPRAPSPKSATSEDEDNYNIYPEENEGVEHAPLNRNQDSRKNSRIFRPPPQIPVTSKEQDNEDISPPEHEGVEHAPLNRNRDSRKNSRIFRPPPQIPVTSKEQDNEDISPPEHDGGVPAQLNQKLDSSNQCRSCNSVQRRTEYEDTENIAHSRQNQEQDSSKSFRRVLPPRPFPSEATIKNEIVIVRSRPNQKQDLSKRTSKCNTVPEESHMTEEIYDDILPTNND